MNRLSRWSLTFVVIALAVLTAYVSGGKAVAELELNGDGGPALLTPVRMYPEWEAKETDEVVPTAFTDVAHENQAERSIRMRTMDFSMKDMGDAVVTLDSPTLKTDMYKPVRFMMREHSIRMKGDCASCHHKTPAVVPEDMDPRHADLLSCDSCHQGVHSVDVPDDRLTLKAAYHTKCISCHKETLSETAPVDCTGCHKQNIPSHEKLFTLTGNAEDIEPTQMTALCLSCHENAGEEMIRNAHYTWEGAVSEWSVAEKDHAKTGKRINSINNNCISPFGDWAACVKCHAGYGVRDENGDFSHDPKNIDCLVCHAEDDTYGKSKLGLPEEDVDLAWAAGMVRNPSRAACGACHYKAGGGNGRKGTLYNALTAPDRNLDVHMGGTYNMTCVDCHKGRQHKIPGRHSSVGVDEGIVTCTQCHSETPHAENSLARHLDRHTAHVECSTCHIPTYSRAQETRDMWDWRTVGKREEIERNEAGNPIYLPDEGTFRWRKDVRPYYDWDNGHTKRYVMGDVIADLSAKVYLSKNIGSMDDPESKISPFKLFQGFQPADTVHKYLLVPQNTGEDGIWESKDWDGAIKLGMKDAGLTFSGEYTFVETELRFRPRHEVAPKADALSCVQCHSDALASEAKASDTCARCHNESRPAKIKDILAKGKDKPGGYMPWERLGYAVDPIKTGSRFKDKK